MPRVRIYTTRARRDGKPNFKCTKCGNDILPGQKRYEWEFYSGGVYRQHESCGYPLRSQLTQSKMSGLYQNIEAIEGHENGWGKTREDVTLNLESVRDTAEEIKSEYEDAAQNFGGQGPSQEMADELDGFISTLEDAIREVETLEGEEETDLLNQAVELAETACNECP